MSKTFITKFPSSVDNDNLPIYGRIVVKCVANNDPDSSSRLIQLQFTKPTIIKKISGASFSYAGLPPYDYDKSIGFVDSAELKANIIYRIIFNTSNVDTYLAIDGKYDIKSIGTNYDWSSACISINLDDLKYCGNLKSISFPCSNTNFEGSLNNVNEGLTSLAIRYNKDLNDISHLTALKSLDIRYSNFSGGDISTLSTLVNLTSLDAGGTNIGGDISTLSTLVNLTFISLSGTQVSVNVDNLAGFTKLTTLLLNKMSLTGDMSKIPANCSFISQVDRKISTNFTWTANGRQNATLLAMAGQVPFDTASMDNMLIDQATCTFKPSADSWTRTISVSGTRTSASDAAVATIQSKGVTITGVTKVS